MPKRPRVALLIETSNHYGRELLRGIRQWEREHGPWALRFVEQGRGATVPRWLKDWQGHGVIARVENAGIARSLKATGLPVVDVSAAVGRPVFPQVVTDSRRVTELALAHFRERGLQQVAYCGSVGFRWAVQRGRSLPKPVGVLASYDVRGQQVIQACQEANLRVPDEVAVLGAHNDELLCELCDPPMSSVRPDAQRAGREAAERLARMMAGGREKIEVTHIEPLGVEVRQSTDMVAVADQRLAAVVRHAQAHACEGINVADLLRAVPMARTALERRCQESLGCTPRELLERIRLDHVRRWLRDSDASVEEIAERTGYAYPEYLTVAFKRVEGVTPRAWRMRARKT